MEILRDLSHPEKMYSAGPLQIDNNGAENALHGVAVGRKNWLFAGSRNGGQRAAILYSLIYTCKINGVEPFAYLRDVITRVNTHPMNCIEDSRRAGGRPLRPPLRPRRPLEAASAVAAPGHNAAGTGAMYLARLIP